MVFFAAIGLIAIVAGIPLLAMYAGGEFVGQKKPHELWRSAVRLIVGAGLLAAVVIAGLSMRTGGMDASEWIMLAWMAGSAIAAWVGLADKLRPQQP